MRFFLMLIFLFSFLSNPVFPTPDAEMADLIQRMTTLSQRIENLYSKLNEDPTSAQQFQIESVDLLISSYAESMVKLRLEAENILQKRNADFKVKFYFEPHEWMTRSIQGSKKLRDEIDAYLHITEADLDADSFAKSREQLKILQEKLKRVNNEDTINLANQLIEEEKPLRALLDKTSAALDEAALFHFFYFIYRNSESLDLSLRIFTERFKEIAADPNLFDLLKSRFFEKYWERIKILLRASFEDVSKEFSISFAKIPEEEGFVIETDLTPFRGKKYSTLNEAVNAVVKWFKKRNAKMDMGSQNDRKMVVPDCHEIFVKFNDDTSTR